MAQTHYATAQEIIDTAYDPAQGVSQDTGLTQALAAIAQVYATLAVADALSDVHAELTSIRAAKGAS